MPNVLLQNILYPFFSQTPVHQTRRACLQVVGHEGGASDKQKEVVDLHSTGNLLCHALSLQPNEEDLVKSCLKDAVPWLEGVAKKLAKDLPSPEV